MSCTTSGVGCINFSIRGGKSQSRTTRRNVSISKKIVVITGSPRQTGNTSALVKAFRNGAESAGHTVTGFFLDAMDIHGCKGCFGGHSSRDCPCVWQDNMMQIYPAVKTCDVIVLASPRYCWTKNKQRQVVRILQKRTSRCWDPTRRNVFSRLHIFETRNDNSFVFCLIEFSCPKNSRP